ncbi:glycosyltransferase family 2 protein [Celeribacter litoreus]|uniref:glycosyltransferase family 2 protein n=1 Tax=Celeribacter litoreus TaxID=2876714 RepID=UPI001CCDFB9A|nr:glycosyltransferase family 2 protein [Celeribacter litoreus]MCA0044524.1 glycosyltransferase family 2 protein [Celeribacter litoreus]
MTILAITCIRDEGPWLLDWLAHHRAAGFTDFLIASHDCTDGTDALLSALEEKGVVTHLPFTPEGEKSVQWQAMKKLGKHGLYQNADLALFFDVDEYLVIEDGSYVSDLLPEDAAAMALRWHLFGNSGLGNWEDRPVIERFRYAAPDDIGLPLAHFFKTLHRPSAFKGLGVHRPKGKEARWVQANGRPLPKDFAAQQARINLFGIDGADERAWLNHYSVRSIDEFLLKAVRGLPNHMDKRVGHGYWSERNFNVVEDTRIDVMLERARAARAELSEFDSLHEECVAVHRKRLTELKSQRRIVNLIWHLTLLAGSTPPGPTQLAAHLKRLKALPTDT